MPVAKCGDDSSPHFFVIFGTIIQKSFVSLLFNVEETYN